MTKLTVLLFVQNGESRIAATIKSVLLQTFTDFILEVYDNASTDRTSEIVHKFAKKDSRVRYFSNNGDLSAFSMMRGELNVASQYACIIHDDCSWDTTYLEKCIAVLESNPDVVLAYTQCQLLTPSRENLRVVRDDFSLMGDDPAERYLQVLHNLTTCTCYHGVSRVPFMRDARIFRLKRLMQSGDHLMLAEMALKGKIAQIEEPLFFRRLAPHQMGTEALPDMYKRLSMWGQDGICFPYLNLVRYHCHMLLQSDLPLAQINRLLRATIITAMERWSRNIVYEIERLIGLILQGDFKRTWAQDDIPAPALGALGENPNIDFLFAAEWNSLLDFTYNFLPTFPRLCHARALLLFRLGRPREALLALERELELYPDSEGCLLLKQRISDHLDGAPR